LTEFKKHTRCPVCEGTNIFSFKKGTFDYTAIRHEDVKITDKEYGKIWDLWRCRDCHHVFANPYPTKEFIFSLYNLVEDPLYEEEAEGRVRNFLGLFRFLEKRHPEKGTLFDVGAATGILLNEARNRGWTPAGIEASGWSVRTAKKKYGLEIEEGDFLSYTAGKINCRALTMVDIIEHVPDPYGALKKAHDLLSPSGTLCLITPDIKSLAARLSGSRWWHFRPAHLAYFCRRSISRLLQRCGFRILKIKKYSWTFSAHYILSRIPLFSFLLKNPKLSSFWKRIPIKLALGDSFEIYAEKVPLE
jgi:2-polyprenyl-3-methyl-5-hydroxy-6-metoxy-1,4-benzoquinol methylase